MNFRSINNTNYLECILLKVGDNQQNFVADNFRSLNEASFDEKLYTLAIYDIDVMIGFILYDYDESLPGWSLSRIMIGTQYQGKGYGKQAVINFLNYFEEKHKANEIFISVSLENEVALKMFSNLGFVKTKQVEYTFNGVLFKEVQMKKTK